MPELQRVENLMDYQVTMLPPSECTNEIIDWIAKGSSARWLACLNPHSYVQALGNERFTNALNGADWLVPDGAGILLASRVNRGKIKVRVTGSDIFEGVMRGLDQMPSSRVFFLGSTPQTLERIRTRVAHDFPRIHIAGAFSPPFKPEYSAEEVKTMLTAINSTKPDVIWVGMTAPKQEIWIAENLANLPSVKFAGAIGAVFDFYAGNVRRSHPFFQHLGLEWLPRLLHEPGRLWRRNFISTPIFLYHILRSSWSRSSN